MLNDWGVIGAAIGYIGLLFLVASYGDRLTPAQRGRFGVLIYPLSLAIYCTSWTFFGSVGFASRTGIEFLAIYLGPILMIGCCTPSSKMVKSSAFRWGTNWPALSRTLTGSSTSVVSMAMVSPSSGLGGLGGGGVLSVLPVLS